MALALTDRGVSFRLFPRARRGPAPLWGRKLHAGAARLRQADGDGLLAGASPMLSLADVVHFLAHEFPRLCGWRFSLARITTSAPHCFCFWHMTPCFGNAG